MKRLFAIALSLASLSGPALACSPDYYLNVDGYCVHRPTPGYVTAPSYYAPPTYAAPPPSTYQPQPSYRGPELDTPSAVCADGSYSYSRNRSGTCSHHGGIRY